MSDEQTFRQKVDAAVAAAPHRSEHVVAQETAADMLAGDIGRALGDVPPAPAPETAPPVAETAVPEWTPEDLAEVHARRTDDDYFEVVTAMQEVAAAGGEEVFRVLDGNPREFVKTYDSIKAKFDARKKAAAFDLSAIPNTTTRETLSRLVEAKERPPAPEATTPDPAMERQKRLEQLRDRASISGTGQRDAEAELLGLLDDRFRK